MSNVKPYPRGISKPITSRAAAVRSSSNGGGHSDHPAHFGALPLFTAKSPPGAAHGAYSYTFVASGDPSPVFAVKSGALPTGVTLNATSGVISGTSVAGTYDFVIQATNSFGEDDATCNVVIT